MNKTQAMTVVPCVIFALAVAFVVFYAHSLKAIPPVNEAVKLSDSIKGKRSQDEKKLTAKVSDEIYSAASRGRYQETIGTYMYTTETVEKVIALLLSKGYNAHTIYNWSFIVVSWENK